MGRETKVGIVVVTSFLLLMGVVITNQMRNGTPTQPDDQVANAKDTKKGSGGVNDDGTEGSEQKPGNSAPPSVNPSVPNLPALAKDALANLAQTTAEEEKRLEEMKKKLLDDGKNLVNQTVSNALDKLPELKVGDVALPTTAPLLAQSNGAANPNPLPPVSLPPTPTPLPNPGPANPSIPIPTGDFKFPEIKPVAAQTPEPKPVPLPNIPSLDPKPPAKVEPAPTPPATSLVPKMDPPPQAIPGFGEKKEPLPLPPAVPTPSGSEPKGLGPVPGIPSLPTDPGKSPFPAVSPGPAPSPTPLPPVPQPEPKLSPPKLENPPPNPLLIPGGGGLPTVNIPKANELAPPSTPLPKTPSPAPTPSLIPSTPIGKTPGPNPGAPSPSPLPSPTTGLPPLGALENRIPPMGVTPMPLNPDKLIPSETPGLVRPPMAITTEPTFSREAPGGIPPVGAKTPTIPAIPGNGSVEPLPLPPLGTNGPKSPAPSIGSNLPPLGGQFPPLPGPANVPPRVGVEPIPQVGKDTTFPPVLQNSVREDRALAGEVNFSQVAKRLYDNDRLGEALWAYNRDRNGFLREGPGGTAPRLNPGDKILVPPLNILERELASTTPATINPASGTRLPDSPIRVGQPTPIPAFNPSPAQTQTSDDSKAYKVAAGGQHILEVARQTLGDQNRWPEIYRLNPDVDPRYPIQAGRVIRLPANARLP